MRKVSILSLILIILLAFTACELNDYGVPGGNTTTTVDPATFDIDGFTKYILSEKGLSRSDISWVENLSITDDPEAYVDIRVGFDGYNHKGVAISDGELLFTLYGRLSSTSSTATAKRTDVTRTFTADSLSITTVEPLIVKGTDDKINVSVSRSETAIRTFLDVTYTPRNGKTVTRDVVFHGVESMTLPDNAFTVTYAPDSPYNEQDNPSTEPSDPSTTVTENANEIARAIWLAYSESMSGNYKDYWNIVGNDYDQKADIIKEFTASNVVTLTMGSNGMHLVTEAYYKDTYILKAK